MALVIDDDDVLLVAELAADAPHHLVGRLGERAVPIARENLLSERGAVGMLAGQKGVVVGDDDLRLLQVGQQFGWQQVELAIVVLPFAGHEHAQAVANRDAGGDDEEGVGEMAVLAVGEFVQRLPGDQHRHHDRFACAGRHLRRQAIQEWIRPGIPLAEFLLDPLVAELAGHLGDVDDRFDRFELAEEEPALALWPLPVVQQARGGAGDALVATAPPQADLLAHAVDELVLLQPVLGPLGVQ
jgi:hypothetical protein